MNFFMDAPTKLGTFFRPLLYKFGENLQNSGRPPNKSQISRGQDDCAELQKNCFFAKSSQYCNETIGSVGKLKDGDPRGCYVLLHIREHSSATVKESIRVEFIRFAYDVEKAVRAVEGSPLPQTFADALRPAR